MKPLSIALIVVMLAVLGFSMTYAQKESGNNQPVNKETVVLLHGLARSNSAMWLLASRLEDAGFHVERIGYSSLNQTPEQILADVSEQIESCCARQHHAVHFVGHSLGGLLIRAYLQDHKVDKLGRVVLMGTPNQGTEIVDTFRDRWWMQFAGPTTLALGTDSDSFPNSLKDPYYPVGVIAGVAKNDTHDEILPGKDDGLVSVESTKLAGMTDFIVIKTGHSMMRYNEDVARQTIAFLKNGRFETQDTLGNDSESIN